MITASGAGAASFCLPPERLKPARAPRPPPPRTARPPPPQQSQSAPPWSPLPPNIPPAKAIEALLLRRTQSASRRPARPEAEDDEEEERPRNQSGGERPSETPRSTLEPSTSLDDSIAEISSVGSIYRVASSNTDSSTSTGTITPRPATARFSIDERLTTTQSPQSSPKTFRKLRRPRSRSQPTTRLNLSLGLQLRGSAAIASPAVSAYGLGIASFAGFEGGNLSGLVPAKPRARRTLEGGDTMSSAPEIRVYDINVAVVGGAGVGKSTFIQKAYDLKKPPGRGESASIEMTVDGTAWNVKLVEVDWVKLDFNLQPLQWPRATDGPGLPFIDGVLVLYDVTNPVSIARLPESLDAFSKASLPVIIASCKVDSAQRQLNPESIEQIGTVGGYEQLQTSATNAESQKKCVAAILSMIQRRKTDKTPRYLQGRRRANSSAANSRAASPRPSTSGHTRAGSEFSSAFLKETPGDCRAVHAAHVGARLPRPPASPALGAFAVHSKSTSAVPTCPSVNSPAANPESKVVSSPSPSSGPAPQITLGPPATPPALEVVSTSPFSMQARNGGYSSQSSLPSQASSDRVQNFYVDTDDDIDGFRDPDEIPILDRDGEMDDFESQEKPVQYKGQSWDELVDRLLSQPMSRSDHNFVVIFLCFYRKFAPPRQLLNAIIDRFERASNEISIALYRIAAQIRYCNVLMQWITSHPNDFAYPKTRRRIVAFINANVGNRSLGVLIEEMKRGLVVEAEDEDGAWAMSDQNTEKRNSMESFMTESGFPEHDMSLALMAQGDYCMRVDSRKQTPQLQVPNGEMEQFVRRKSETSRSFDSASTSSSSQGFSFIRPEVSASGSGSGSSGLDPRYNKVLVTSSQQYDLFMSIPVEDVASELTRLDWIEFSKILTRDLIRHISLPAEQREKSRSLVHVNKMISHFNHVAYWVASLILEKSKPKYRARVLEKFMEIAWSLRHKNNYNGLGAVIAGINGTAVHRLSMTRELVNPNVHKNFMRLELLMGTHKSHSKYRLAWENTSTPRIPFLPLHRRDLVSADEGNRTFLQDKEKINWNKFQVMGDVLILIVRAQEMPYKELKGNAIVEKLISDAVMSMDDDGLYERSVQLENSATMSKSSKRSWFR